MNELALFAGAGGGILGGHLLGWRTICAVEWEAYPASVLVARQNDKILPPFPIWDDVQTFDGKPWRGIVDVVSGGFPCQDISAAGGGLESQEQEVQCGNRWHGLLARYNQDTHLWKTVQCSLLEDSELSLETFPRWGMTRNGECWEQTTLELTIKEKEFGLLPNNETFFHTPNTTGLDGGSNSRKALRKRMEQLPTPQATDYRSKPTSSSWKAKGGINYSLSNPEIQAKWPTPTASQARSEGMILQMRKLVEDGLTTVQEAESMIGGSLTPQRMKMWPTPMASDNRDRGHMESPSIKRRLEIGKQVSLGQSVSPISGQLNPTWVEWLMGWPLEWTDLKPLEMDKCHFVQQQLGTYLKEE